ncbi:MAG: radical SAM protein [Candidatus Gastranaerophilaceae bacterium]
MRYKSCTKIENGINFDIESIKLCCQYSAKGGGNTKVIENYSGGYIDWDSFFAFKKTIKDIHKSGGVYHKCEGCIYLEEKDWQEFDGFNFFNLDYWTYCNCNCIYCHTHNKKDIYNTKKNYDFLPILKDMINKNLLMRGGHVSFGGGEVCYLKEFEECLKIFLDYDYFIRIHSGCMDYSKVIEDGLRKGKVDLIVSVDAGTEEMHVRIKEIKTFDRVWNNLTQYAKIQQNNGLVKVKYIVIPGINDTKDEINIWIDKCIECGIGYVIQEIESQWFYANRKNIPEYIYDLFSYTKQLANSKGLVYGEYERAAHMLAERQEKLSSAKEKNTQDSNKHQPKDDI